MTVEKLQLSREDRLVVQCARTHLTPDGITRINALLQDGIDWATVLRRADEHHVMALLYNSLRQVQGGIVPPDVSTTLDQFFRRNARHNTLLALELLQLQELFESNHMPFIFFKGCTLASAAYGDLALRRFGDLDVLLREQDIASARKLLLARHYEHRQATETDDLPRWNYHYTLHHAINGHSLELHWQIAPKYYYFPLRFDDVMQRSQLTALIGAKVRTCAPEDLLQILCVHAAKHGWLHLAWVADIAELVRATPGLDWDFVLRQTNALHSRRAVLLGLVLAHTLLDASLPDDVQGAIHADPAIADLCQRAYHRLFSTFGPNFDFEGYAFQWRVRDGLRDRLIYLRAKQPMMDPSAAEPIPALIAPADRLLYGLLRIIRAVRVRLLRPLRQLYTRKLPAPELNDA